MRLPPEEIAQRLADVSAQPAWFTLAVTAALVFALWRWRRGAD